MEIDDLLVLRHLLNRHPRYAIFGCGQCGVAILNSLRTYSLPMPMYFLDETVTRPAVAGIPVRLLTGAPKKELDAVVIGSDFHQSRMRQRIAAHFGEEFTVLDLLRSSCLPVEAKTYFQRVTTHSRATEMLFSMNVNQLGANQKARIHFIFQDPSLWPSWETLWTACLADPAVDARMIMCPRETQPLSRNLTAQPLLDFLRSRNIDPIPFDEYEMDERKPHVVVLQTPYDHSDRPKWLHADAIRAKGIRVAYVAYGLEFDESPEPGGHLDQIHYMLNVHRNAWRVFTCSRLIRQGYADFCPAGSEHVRVLGHPKFDGLHDLSRFPLPDHIRKKAGGRSIIVWQLHFPVNSYGAGKVGYHTLPFDRTVAILNILQEQNDFFLLLTHHPRFKEVSIQRGVATGPDIDAFLDQANNGTNSALYATPDYRPVLAAGDAFISEISSLLLEMIATQRPVLHVHDIPVRFNPFGRSIVSSYYTGTSPSDVRAFVEMLRSGEDALAEARRDALKNIEFFDGRAGERIKNHILAELRAGK